MNNRRKLIIAFGAGVATVPFAPPFARIAQAQSKVWRVGVLYQSSRPDSLESHVLGAFIPAMRDLGYVEGKNLVIEWRFGNDAFEHLSELAADLVRSKVDIIVASGTQCTSAAQKATTTIPIVMTGVSDPVGSGFVKSLAKPGGNITGQSNLIGDMGAKHLEMLLAFVPRLSRVAVLMHPDNSGHGSILKGVEAAARKHGVQVLPLAARTLPEIENAFAIMAQKKSQALIVANDSLFGRQSQQIAGIALKNRLLSVAARFNYTEAGLLMSYGSNNREELRRAVIVVDKILKGAKAAVLPVEQPTKFELIINGKTAKAMGLKIPQTLLIMATKVIE